MKTKNTKKVSLWLLKKLHACKSGVEYWKSLPKEHREDPLWLMQHAIESDDEAILKDANWLICRLFSDKNTQRYAVFAARQVLHIFEEKYPDDDRPRKAIEAAEAVIKRNTADNRKRARLAADNTAHLCIAAEDAADCAAFYGDASLAASSIMWAANYAAAYDSNEGKYTIIKALKYGMELLK